MTRAPPDETGADSLRRLNRLLIRAVKALSEDGRADFACRIAAEAWSILRRERPEEAEKLNGVLHVLTRPTHVKKED